MGFSTFEFDLREQPLPDSEPSVVVEDKAALLRVSTGLCSFCTFRLLSSTGSTHLHD